MFLLDNMYVVCMRMHLYVLIIVCIYICENILYIEILCACAFICLL